MRRITWNEVESGGGRFSQHVRPADTSNIQDVAVLAVPRRKAVSLQGSLPPGRDKETSLRFRHTEPFKARALVVNGAISAKLYAVREGKREWVADVEAGTRADHGFLPADGTFSFKEATAQEFILEPCTLPPEAVRLTSEPRVAQVASKQLGRLHPTPSPTWESYQFKASVKPDDASTVVHQKEILNLTDKLATNGMLTCELPARIRGSGLIRVSKVCPSAAHG